MVLTGGSDVRIRRLISTRRGSGRIVFRRTSGCGRISPNWSFRAFKFFIIGAAFAIGGVAAIA